MNYIGIDGGGTGTRVRILDSKKNFLCEFKGPSSALSQGIEKAWEVILITIKDAFDSIRKPLPNNSELIIGIGISGLNNTNWKNDFLKIAPKFSRLVVNTDGFTSYLGSHGHKPGVMLALGTGSIGISMDQAGDIKTVSGWGYPSGDEASGSWLGMQAVKRTQKVLDGRAKNSKLTSKIMEKCGSTYSELLDWVTKASAKEYATLSPLVFEVINYDRFAKKLVNSAILDIYEMLYALDKTETLPITILGALGDVYSPYLPKNITDRIIKSNGSSLDGSILSITENEE